MSCRFLRHALLAQACGLALACGSPAAAAVDETARSEAAVLAVEEHWLQAEGTGDTAWLAQMLLPSYRSVGADGAVHDRAAILAHARSAKGSDRVMRRIQAYLSAHPSGKAVRLEGNLAIVSFYDPAQGPQHIRSSDVFVYRDGGWHAVYSQHSTAR
ncbi:nuclear transport factor 2 family protein [Fulvimonas yonginensis]|uniref:Nuclear transport factor 2 family protein n=1 Tax=Fulvimonas yonginensis TaxID=1495200 RepID=A0ABU8JCR8_9GAMM